MSIVTPSFNQGRFLEETIRSVLAQDYANIEYIVMDAGSEDESLAIIRRYEPWLASWESRRDDGQADAVNRGWALTTGQYVWWLNSDDVLAPGAIRESVEYLEQHPSTGLVHGDIQHMDADGRPLTIERFRPFDLRRALTRTEWISQPGALARRAVIDTLGMLDASLHFQMDHDFLLRAALRFDVGYLPRVQASFRHHAESKTTTQTAVAADEVITIHERLFADPGLPPAIRGLRRQATASAYRYAAAALYFADDFPGAWQRLRTALRIYPLLGLRPEVVAFLARLAAASVLPGGRASRVFRIARGLRR